MNFEPALPDERVNVSGTHPLKEAGLLVGGLVGGVVALALLSAVLVDRIVPLLPTSLEARVFGGSWLPLGDDDEEEEVDPSEAALQALVDRLAGHWPGNPYQLRVSIWSAETPNAFALPGGWIGVTRGLLDSVESENELAFVLGHEIGHFHNRDHLRGLGRGVALGIVLAAVGSTGAGVAGDLASLAGALAQRGFDREQESDADRFGVDLVVAEYGHAGGAAEFFARMPEADGVAGDIESYLSTHPLSAERIDAIEAYAEGLGRAAEGWLAPLPEALLDDDEAPLAEDGAAGDAGSS